MRVIGPALTICLAALMLTAFAACKKDEPTAVSTTAEPESTADAGEAEVILAKADAYDGTEDRVIAKCAACALHMDGSVDNVVMTHGYTMRFCSPDCKVRFEEDLEDAILALEVPEE